MTNATFILVAVIVTLALAVVALLVMLIRSDRENQALRRENAQLLRELDDEVALADRRASADAYRIHALREAVDSANSCNSHFVEWATEKPVEPNRGASS